MGIYLVDVGRESWFEGEVRGELNRVLAERGLGPYAGPPEDLSGADRFEEKVSPSMEEFSALCDRHGVRDVLDVSLFLPLEFDGLIDLPVGSAYDETTKVFSSQRLRELMRPLAAEVGLPAVLPRGPLELTLAFADTDPLTFYVAMYSQAADFSVRHCCPMEYV